ncbi:MAG: hypothetical protein GKR87_02195 [Kiritimatiellae bacterium]|nr:hypothetical protein [Kiritimatiellia bacterium]
MLVSITALVLGYLLSEQRNALKTRIQKLEKNTVQVAKNLRHEDLNSTKQLKFYEVMDRPLKKLMVHSENMYIELQDTKQELDNKNLELTQTKETLVHKEQALTETLATVQSLEETLSQTQTDLSQAQVATETAQVEKQELEDHITDLRTQLAESEDKTLELEEQVTQLDDLVERLSPARGPKELKEGVSGTIRAISPDWNFVVLDIGRKNGLVPEAEMMIHREDRLVGKIKIASVEDEMAVADVLPNWEQMPIEKGDRVLAVNFR